MSNRPPNIIEIDTNNIPIDTRINELNLSENDNSTDNIGKENEINIPSQSKINMTPIVELKKENSNIGSGLEPNYKKEVRVATIGNVDSGKSTLVGVLTKCVLDDGRGHARQLVFNFNHEQENGRTSSVTHEIMGFKNTQQIEPYKSKDKKNNTWSKIVNESDKIISFIDLCGHEKYLKTTIFGLTGLVPDYSMIVIGANMGVSRMTKEHIGIALALRMPLFVVVTKIDIAPADIYKQTLDSLNKVLKSSGAQKMTVIVRDNDDISLYADNMLTDKICPIFCVSSVTGKGIDQLRKFIGNLESRNLQNNNLHVNPSSDQEEFLIDGTYNVKGLGLVVSGILMSGNIAIGQVLQLGPDKKGEFRKVTVKSIHFNCSNVNEINSGTSACLHIKSKDKESLKSTDIRKGMVLLNKNTNCKSALEFEAEVVILHNATTIKTNYQAVIHTGVVRQTAKVISMNANILTTGDKGIVKFQFINSPEYLHEGATILFREGRTRGIGHILKVYFK